MVDKTVALAKVVWQDLLLVLPHLKVLCMAVASEVCLPSGSDSLSMM